MYTFFYLSMIFFQAISPSISNKILREAFKQQREIQDEETLEQNPTIAAAFNDVCEVPSILNDLEQDVDDYAGPLESESQFGGDYEVFV